MPTKKTSFSKTKAKAKASRATPMRTESDSMGKISVPGDAYWGAQTQRSLKYFNIGDEVMPPPVIHALGMIKLACATVNTRLGRLSPRQGKAIAKASRQVMAGKWDAHFPLKVWQTGSGTQSNMNANEVIANLAIKELGGTLGSKDPIHPNDHCNASQSSNDVFPTAMHIAIVLEVQKRLLPSLQALHHAVQKKAIAWRRLLKSGRTHLQDATPITLGQEFSGYASQIALAIQRVKSGLPHLYALAQGGTAVGTGLNAPAGFAQGFAKEIARLTGLPFTSAANKFEALATSDAVVAMAGHLNTTAVSLFKIASDIRLLASGPRVGLGELALPANEPGSSIMPGKVNPTQCEALTMVCTRVMGNATTITMAGSQGHLELNVFRPVMVDAALQSIGLLADACVSFRKHCVEGIEPRRNVLRQNMEKSLMLVTALAPLVGYDTAANIAHAAYENDSSLRVEALKAGVSAKDFDSRVRPQDMIKPAPAAAKNPVRPKKKSGVATSKRGKN